MVGEVVIRNNYFSRVCLLKYKYEYYDILNHIVKTYPMLRIFSMTPKEWKNGKYKDFSQEIIS